MRSVFKFSLGFIYFWIEIETFKGQFFLGFRFSFYFKVFVLFKTTFLKVFHQQSVLR